MYVRPDSAVANVRTPSGLPETTSGTQMYDFRPSDRIRRRWRSSLAPCTSMSSVISATISGLPVRRTAKAPLGDSRVGRVVPHQLVREADLVGVLVGDGQPPQRAVVVRHVHGGPVGEVRHGQVRHLLQRAFVVDHARQGGAGLGQIAGGLLGPLLLVDVGAGAEPAGDRPRLVVDGHGSDRDASGTTASPGPGAGSPSRTARRSGRTPPSARRRAGASSGWRMCPQPSLPAVSGRPVNSCHRRFR